MSDRHKLTDGIFTVGELRTMLVGVPADTQVVLDDGSGWWENVREIVIPQLDHADEYSALTLFRGDAADMRQF